MRRLAILLACLGLVLPGLAAAQPVRVYAAASLTPALTELADAYQAAGHERPVLVFAASSALAKQIENGAPADVFASADNKWMDYLAQRGKIDLGSRRDRLGNTLVLIAPRGRPFTAKLVSDFDLPTAFEGRLCTGEPDVVPVGTYAKQALTRLGWWSALAPRMVGTDDVRTALAFVERGECPAGIVYATDAAGSDKVTVVSRFPDGSHDPVRYPFARTPTAAADASDFLQFLDGERARAVFVRLGFTALTP